jgi:quinol-cytochrome oxidoreductase complex cytochrome b subunit
VKNPLKGLFKWFEDRTGLAKMGAGALHERIPGGISWRYVFGSALTFTFILQAVTGVLLAFHFSPSATDAWGSVYYIEHELTMGSLIRGVHHFGSGAMIVLIALHMIQTFLHGAYKAPREVNWLSGILLLAIVLGFSLTGYLLPWDQKGYWATRVATNIMGSVPVIGEGLQTLVQGGSDYGNYTLTRFYALHVFILPASLLALLAIHIKVMRKHGITPKPGTPDEELKSKTGWFWPGQLLIDMIACLVVLAVLVCLAVLVSAPLDAPADPASSYEARPEWYFMALFQLLKYFEGPMMVVGTVVLPGLAGLFLVVLPFLDKSEDRRIRSRKVWTVLFFGGLVGVIALTAVSMLEDASSESYQKNMAVGQRNACEAVHYAKDPTYGIDAAGKVVVFQGKKLFRAQGCTDCHRVGAEGGQGKETGPDLTGFLSRAWIKRFLTDPYDDHHFGKTRLKQRHVDEQMPPFTDISEDAEDLNDAVEYIASLSGQSYDPPTGYRASCERKGVRQ